MALTIGIEHIHFTLHNKLLKIRMIQSWKMCYMTKQIKCNIEVIALSLFLYLENVWDHLYHTCFALTCQNAFDGIYSAQGVFHYVEIRLTPLPLTVYLFLENARMLYIWDESSSVIHISSNSKCTNVCGMAEILTHKPYFFSK